MMVLAALVLLAACANLGDFCRASRRPEPRAGDSTGYRLQPMEHPARFTDRSGSRFPRRWCGRNALRHRLAASIEQVAARCWTSLPTQWFTLTQKSTRSPAVLSLGSGILFGMLPAREIHQV